MTNYKGELRKIFNDINKLEKFTDFVDKFTNDLGLLEARYYNSYGLQKKEFEKEFEAGLDLLLELQQELLNRKRVSFSDIVC